MLPDELCDIMLASQKRAYGDGLDQSTLNPYMWVCKVHYYSTDLAFYNYPYTFGGLLAPNITPDPKTGIGLWSADQFYRAMHEGVNRHGQDMYPAMPYDFYTRITREDSDAIERFVRSAPLTGEKILAFLKEKKHPALSMEPLIAG